MLRSRIAALGWTHLDVDHRAGLSDGHTSKILCGMKKPSGETLTRLCAALGLALKPVVLGEENHALTDDRALMKSPPSSTLTMTQGDGDGDEAADQFSH
jgi:transcriptional regulator with XRE-family HTH domain